MRDDATFLFLYKGRVVGTPRTYGNTKNDDIWRQAIIAGQWEGTESVATLQIPAHLDFQFRVNPHSPRYHGNVSCNGPDLNTMVIGALGGLVHCRNPERPTLRLFQHGGLCRVVTASKSFVESDEQSGFTLQVKKGDVVPFDNLAIESGLSFSVARQSLKKDRRRAVQQAAEEANCRGYRAPRGTRIEIVLAFAMGLSRNPLSADWLGAAIDGLGASRTGAERFFDGPPTQEFGYDDSVVFKLTVAQVSELPSGIGLHISCANIDISDSTDTY